MASDLFNQAFAEYAQPNNILSSLIAPGPPAPDMSGLSALAASSPPPDVSAPRSRRSLLDIIGGIADTVASVGGAQPLYRANLDAAAERQRQAELDAMKRQQFDQQQKLGEQTIASNDQTLQDTAANRIGLALGGASQAEDPAAAFAASAPMLGIPADKAAQIGSILQNNPKAAGALAIQFGFDPLKIFGPQNGGNPYSGQVFPMFDPKTGQTRAFTLNRQTGQLEDVTPAGQTYTPSPVHVVDQGNQQTVIDSRSGRPVTRPYAVSGKPPSGTQTTLGPDGQPTYSYVPGAASSPAQTATDTQFGKDYAEYVAAGGSANTQSALEKLNQAIDILKGGNVTGGVTGYLPEGARLPFNRKSVEAQQLIETVVQNNLRPILGAQFTQKEGENLLRRVFDPRQSTAENLSRAQNLARQLQRAAQAREDAAAYYEKNGSLAGFKGPVYTISGGQIVAGKPTSQASGPSLDALDAEMRRRGLK